MSLAGPVVFVQLAMQPRYHVSFVDQLKSND